MFVAKKHLTRTHFFFRIRLNVAMDGGSLPPLGAVALDIICFLGFAKFSCSQFILYSI